MSLAWAENKLAAVRRDLAVVEERARDLRAREEKLNAYIEVERERLTVEAMGTTGNASAAEAAPALGDVNPSAQLPAQVMSSVVTVLPVPSKAARAREAATTMIREAGRTMATKELIEPLRRLGIEPWSPRRPNRIVSDLGKVLADAPGLTHFKGVGWGLREWQVQKRNGVGFTSEAEDARGGEDQTEAARATRSLPI